MNKWQIICPLVTMGIFALALAIAVQFATKRNLNRAAYLAAARQVGRDLVTSTNSDRLIPLRPALKTALAELLASRAKVHQVQWETLRSSIPGVVLSLENEDHQRLQITLRWDPKLKKWAAVSHAYPVTSQVPAPR